MFRVLSEEESKRVTRWQAPDLGTDTGTVANTRQQAHPRQPEKEASIRSLLGALDLKPGHQSASSAAPRLQPVNVVDVLASQPGGAAFTSAQSHEVSDSDEDTVASAHMLQTSYDEGYARGYAEGNAALHQHSVNELRRIISGLSKANEQHQRADIEHQVVGLSLDIARLVILHEISVDERTIQDIVVAGLEQLPGTSQAVRQVHLHPLDANMVRRHLQEDDTISVLDDPTLDRGDCRIESGASVLNAGVEDWLHTVSEKLAAGTSP